MARLCAVLMVLLMGAPEAVRAATPQVQALDALAVNRALATEIVRGIAGGRLDGLEALAQALEGESPEVRADFAPCWDLVRETLKDPILRARVAGRQDRLNWLEWRIAAAFAPRRR